MTIEVGRLSNGMQVITEAVNTVETVALGIWLPCGSRDEAACENGMFHFIEHTLFKGTPSRNAREIAEAVEGYGGLLDAYTSKEDTCYSIRVRDVHLEKTLEVLADMLINPAFRGDEMDRERQVILEEIKMEEDNPEEVVFEHSVSCFWKDHALSRPILGTVESVSQFTRDQVNAFHKRFYNTNDLVVAAAGKLDHDDLCGKLEKLFPSRISDASLPQRETPKVFPSQVYLHNNHFEQVNFCLNFEGLSQTDDRRHVLTLLSTLLGGGMSSRLFQNIREDRGLAYHIGSFTSAYSDCGQITLYGGCSPENFDQVIRLCLDELKRLKSDLVTEEELARAREQCHSSLVMGLESTTSRTAALAKDWITLNRIFDYKRTMSDIARVTTTQIRDMAQLLLTDRSLGLSALGKLNAKGPKIPWSVD